MFRTSLRTFCTSAASSSSSSSSSTGAAAARKIIPPKKTTEPTQAGRVSKWVTGRDPNEGGLNSQELVYHRMKMFWGLVLACGFLVQGAIWDQQENPGSLPVIRHDGRSMVT